MSLPNSLVLHRMTNATIGSTIDDKVGELEQAICDILGVPLDTEITAAAFALDAYGRNNAILRQRGVAGTSNGVWIRDITNNSECLLCVNNGYLEVYENTGTEDVPVWVLRTRCSLTTGGWSSSGAAVSVGVYRASAVSVPNTTVTVVQWTGAKWEVGASTLWAVGSPTRLVAPQAGIYRVSYQADWGNSTAGTYRWCSARRNGIVSLGYHVHPPVATSGLCAITASMDVALNANDYLELVVQQDSGGALNLNAETGSSLGTFMTLTYVGPSA